MKNGKAAEPSRVLAEMLKAAPDICSKIIADFTRYGKVLSDWSDSILVSLFKGKGNVLDQNNYCGLALSRTIDHVLKVIERVAENIIPETVNNDEMLFDVCPS